MFVIFPQGSFLAKSARLMAPFCLAMYYGIQKKKKCKKLKIGGTGGFNELEK
jgi:hypothetical protein